MNQLKEFYQQEKAKLDRYIEYHQMRDKLQAALKSASENGEGYYTILESYPLDNIK